MMKLSMQVQALMIANTLQMSRRVTQHLKIAIQTQAQVTIVQAKNKILQILTLQIVKVTIVTQLMLIDM
jgi:hypothetical protein